MVDQQVFTRCFVFLVIINCIPALLLFVYYYSDYLGRQIMVDSRFSGIPHPFDSYASWKRNASYLKILLTPEQPVPGMCFIAQKPGVNYPKSAFPQEILTGDPHLQTRTYPNETRNDSCSGCFPYIYHNVINAKGCDDIPSIKVLILITTVPKETAMRKVIRETWGRNTKTVRTVFLFGVGWSIAEQDTLFNESMLHGDILQDSYIDAYFNLSMKVLSGYHWWSKHCKNAPFVLRTAGDNFVNIPRMLHLIASKPSWPRVIIGHCWQPSLPMRIVSDKCYVTYKELPHKMYIPYCVGTSFITPASTVDFILETSPNVPYFPIEDGYFGMVMAQNVQNGSTIMDIPGFNLRLNKTDINETTKCKVPSNMISIHNVKSPELMNWAWKYCRS